MLSDDNENSIYEVLYLKLPTFWGSEIRHSCFADEANSRHREQYISAKSYSVDVISLCKNHIQVG